VERAIKCSSRKYLSGCCCLSSVIGIVWLTKMFEKEFDEIENEVKDKEESLKRKEMDVYRRIARAVAISRNSVISITMCS
jgi:hypothetical protein